MPWSQRNLSSLFQHGFFATDYPGLRLDHEEFHYYYGHFPLGPQDEGLPVHELEDALEKWTEYHKVPATYLLYWDELGHGIFITTKKPDRPGQVLWREAFVELDQADSLSLKRIYTAEGRSGVQRMTFNEEKDPYLTVEKFLGCYLNGWAGLLQHRSEQERQSLFEEFHPFPPKGKRSEAHLLNLGLRCQLSYYGLQGQAQFKELKLKSPILNASQL